MAEKTEKKPIDPGQFLKEVRQEGNKVTWPSRKETGVTTVMVIWMTIIASLFLFSVDFIIQHLVRGVLDLFA
ncbi:MAG TPA: preprotein translocase subunit SecE [Alphaproteobacteria bacterium]|nr:preprotein translocase subunit SecE [Rhodospirillaceae bacterium]HRJ12167.1 preprotein translocase subunit SecE [Alphaproteobacteria bacterium]